MKAHDLEAFALSLAALNGLETVFSQAPIEPSPRADHDEVAVRPQHAGDFAGMQATLRLRDQVEEVIGVRKPARPAALESDAALGVEANSRHRRIDCLGGGIDAPDPCGGKLTGEEEHAVAFAAFDLEHPFWPGGNVQHRGGKRGERGRGHRPII